MATIDKQRISEELDFLIEKNENMRKTNEYLEQAISLQQKLMNDLEGATSVFTPLMRDYLKDLTSIRMAIGREVQDILRTVGELREIHKTVPNLKELAIHFKIMQEVLTPEFIELLGRLKK